MTTAPVSFYPDTDKAPWVERRPGIFWKTLWEDADGRHKAVLMRYSAGSVVPRHRHIGDEQIWVIEGAIADDTGVCAAGSYARRPPGCVHTVESVNGALVFAVISGPTEPV